MMELDLSLQSRGNQRNRTVRSKFLLSWQVNIHHSYQESKGVHDETHQGSKTQYFNSRLFWFLSYWSLVFSSYELATLSMRKRRMVGFKFLQSLNSSLITILCGAV